MGGCGGGGGSWPRISPWSRSDLTASRPCNPAWAPAAANSRHDCSSIAGLFGGIAPVPATTLNSPEKVRALPVTDPSSLALPAVSVPANTVNSGTAMLSFLAPPPVTLTYTSVPGPPGGCAGDGHVGVITRKTTSSVIADIFRQNTD